VAETGEPDEAGFGQRRGELCDFCEAGDELAAVSIRGIAASRSATVSWPSSGRGRFARAANAFRSLASQRVMIPACASTIAGNGDVVAMRRPVDPSSREQAVVGVRRDRRARPSSAARWGQLTRCSRSDGGIEM
jgi:hypothetical protein